MTRLSDKTSAIDEIACHMSREPYVTLGVALGIGYLVGRGFSTNVASTLLGLSVRVALSSAVESYLREASADRGSRNEEMR